MVKNKIIAALAAFVSIAITIAGMVNPMIFFAIAAVAALAFGAFLVYSIVYDALTKGDDNCL